MKITVTKEIRIASRSVRKTVELDFGEGIEPVDKIRTEPVIQTAETVMKRLEVNCEQA